MSIHYIFVMMPQTEKRTGGLAAPLAECQIGHTEIQALWSDLLLRKWLPPKDCTE
jgi:hypothetical protein